jgi:hypothetical protein
VHASIERHQAVGGVTVEKDRVVLPLHQLKGEAARVMPGQSANDAQCLRINRVLHVELVCLLARWCKRKLITGIVLSQIAHGLVGWCVRGHPVA